VLQLGGGGNTAGEGQRGIPQGRGLTAVKDRVFRHLGRRYTVGYYIYMSDTWYVDGVLV